MSLIQMRRMLLALVLAGTVGLMLELVFLEHTEGVWQSIPFVILAVGLAGGLAVWFRPKRRTIRVFQASMVLCVAAGLLGLYLHYRGNAGFERELDPSVRGFELIWRSLRGATPTLAPAALVQLGLLGLIQTYRHPALRRRNPDTRPEFAGHPTLERRNP